MRISRIHIQNFGILADVEIDSSDTQQHLVFVNGRNSRGKTSFLGSLKWGLLGEQPKWAEQVNKWALSGCANGDTVTVRVVIEILLDHDEGTAVVERSSSFSIVDNKVKQQIGGESLTVKVRGTSQNMYTDVLVSPEIWLEQKFPKRLKNFFLFDGELMQNFFDANVKMYIADAVREIAGVDKFEELAVQFSLVEEAANKKVATLAGSKAQSAEETYRNSAKFENLLISDLDEKKEALTKLELRLDEILAIKSGNEATLEQAKRAQDVAQLLKLKSQKLAEEESLFQSKVLNCGTQALLSPLFGAVENEYERAIKLGIDVPPKFNPKHIAALITEGSCICGCDLRSNKEAMATLKGLVDQSNNASQIGDLLSSVNETLNNEKSKMPLQLQLIRESNERIKELNQEILELREEQDKLAEQGVDLSNLAQQALAMEQRKVQADIHECSQEIGSLNKDIDLAKQKTIKAKAEFEKATKGLSGAEKFKRQSEVASSLAKAAKAIHSMALESVRSQLENAMSEKFAKIADGAYQTKVTDDFEVLTLDSSGEHINLSAGLQMMKGYIFAIALREVINLGLPLVVDSPFGKLDAVFVEYVSQMLAGLATKEFEGSSRQIIFMMHDGEYTPYTRKHFMDSNPDEWYLAWEIDGVKSIAGQGLDPAWFDSTAWKDWNEGKIK